MEHRASDAASAAGTTVTSTVEYRYNADNLRVARILNSNGATAGGKTAQFYAYDGNDVLFDFLRCRRADLRHLVHDRSGPLEPLSLGARRG